MSDKPVLTGGLTNSFLVSVDHPQREGQAPYVAECEDITDALELTPDEFCIVKSIWRTAMARKGQGKPGNTPLYDAEKQAHYANRILRKAQRAHELSQKRKAP
jgi:hypothetical protein